MFEDGLKPTALPLVAGSMHGAESSGRRWVMTQRVFGLGPPTQSDVRHSSAASPPPPACRSRCFTEPADSLSTNNQPFQWPMAARASNVPWRYSRSKPNSKFEPSSLHLNNSQIHLTAFLLWEISTMGALQQIPDRDLKSDLFWISKVNIANSPAGENYNNKIRSSEVPCQRSRANELKRWLVSEAQKIDGADRRHGATHSQYMLLSSMLVLDTAQIKGL